MKRIYSLSKVRNVAVTIGIFDSVHRGHQEIFKRLTKEARQHNIKSLVITFHPHPRKILNPQEKVPFITSLEHRLRLIGRLGVDFSFVMAFTKSLSKMNSADFIDEILVHSLHVNILVVGENFLFGNKNMGNFRSLKKASKIHGFKLVAVKAIKINGRIVSSTRIRCAIERGDLKNASLMLGRPVAILGTVVKGRRVGRKLGFPTANINPHHEAIPPSGVYAVDAKLENRSYRGLLNIGRRPTFGNNSEPTIELYILNFSHNIYNRDIEIIFKRKLRNERKFASISALQKQIKQDIKRAR
jgi:riboflavin kinase/FMN adenylyltransferase